jgi:CheY-like chemotaxis protein
MAIAPLSWDEFERLAALQAYGILDTDPEVAFDDLTAVAATVCQTPISLISLVDSDRQWFKSRHGLHVPETPREWSFCAHAILEDDVFVVEDATRDARFVDNPLTTGDLRVKFYAGTPLVSPSGHAVGTLCVIDHVPRTLTSEQLDGLKRLGRQVVSQMELRRMRTQGEAAAAALVLTTMSRELRTPLNSVLGISTLLAETPLSSEQQALLQLIQQSGEQLLGVVDRSLEATEFGPHPLTRVNTVDPPARHGHRGRPDGASVTPVAEAASGNYCDLQGRTVLVAEDDQINVTLITQLLKAHRCKVTVVRNGNEAVKRCQQMVFDLILMDVMMPIMDGCDATIAIRALQSDWTRTVPIVALTAGVLDQDRQRCLDAGMSDYLSKPLRRSALDAALRRVLATLPLSA